MATDAEATALSNRRFESNKKKQTCLTVSVILLVIISIILLSLLLFFALKGKGEKDDKETPCFTKDCVATASTLISAMDESVDPCDNFYNFACKNFQRKNPVPEDKLFISTFLEFHELMNLQQKILIESYDSYKKTPVLMKAQEIYHVCLNTSYQKQKEINSFKTFVKTELGGWPLQEGSWESKLKLEDLFSTIMKTADQSDLFNGELTLDPEDSSKYIFKFEVQPMDAFLSRRVVFSPEDEEDVMKQKIFFKILDIFGRPSNTTMYNDLEQMDKLEEELNNIISDTSGEAITIMTYTEFKKLTNNTIDWFKIMNRTYGDQLIKKDGKVIVEYPNRFKKLPALLKRFPQRVLANRMISGAIFYKLLLEIAPDLGKETIALLKEAEFSIPNKKTRLDNCFKFVLELFPAVITRMFVETYPDKNTREEAGKIVEYILKAYKEQIENSQWLDEETKNKALEKIKKMKRFIQYPDFTFNDQELEEHYSDVPDIQPTHFLNYVKMKPVAMWKDVEVKLFPQTSKQWPVHPMEINAAYYAQYNAMYFQAGILMLPFFDVNRPRVVNYGMAGAIVGHELGHAFDNTGKNFDADGNNVNWWSDKTAEVFAKKSKCLEDQYSNYCPEYLEGGPDKICVDGLQTLGENLADTTGLKAAFEGYKMWKKDFGEEKPLPGLEKYTSEQLFFIGYGYTWCENVAPDKWLQRFAGDVHSPGQYRVLGTLANSEDFREAFKCDKKGLMNRAEDTCTVW